ncbi:hypothetical protein [Parenemella sanctibonifatiensis]|uniref:Uncharacterized protein n=1 Tax=Parenemella sanctibonifatiensis TaxID=2016505 RepID=A0A255ED59_9ACTN|nr:hypothetical protein [Parenemella sanctibonifatiensis]OYN89210.1 hypothetical protein CGZ92_03120 [Parenemella sanctibonifatiensis]
MTGQPITRRWLPGWRRLPLVSTVLESGPRPAEWSRPLQLVMIVAGLAAVVAIGLTLTAGWLRATGPLELLGEGATIPAVAMNPVLWLMVVVMSLALTAALHVSGWVRAAIWLVCFSAVALLTSTALSLPAAMVAVACLGVYIGFAVARAGQDFAAYEFAVVLILVSVSAVGPSLLSVSTAYGIDLRPQAILQFETSVMVLAIPILMVAGVALAQITVQLVRWGTAQIGRIGATTDPEAPAGGPLIAVASALTVAVLATAVAQFFAPRAVWWQGQWAEAWSCAVVLAAVAVALRGLVGLGNRGRSSRPPRNWEDMTLAVSAAIVGLMVPISVLLSLSAMIGVTAPQVTEVVTEIWRAVLSPPAIQAWRCLVALVLLVWARAQHRRGGGWTVWVLCSFAALVVLTSASAWTAGRVQLTVDDWAVGQLAVLAALVGVIVAAVRRRLTRPRVLGLLATAGLALAIPFREFLAAPLEVLIGVGAVAVALFGVVWELATGADLTRQGSRAFPQATRVLLWAANGLLGLSVVALAALTRAPDSTAQAFAELGDYLLGWPWLMAALILGVVQAWTTAGRTQPPEPALVPPSAVGPHPIFAPPRPEQRLG